MTTTAGVAAIMASLDAACDRAVARRTTGSLAMVLALPGMRLADLRAAIDGGLAVDPPEGPTPLCLAAVRHGTGAVRMLLQAGADPDRHERMVGPTGHDDHPLHAAVRPVVRRPMSTVRGIIRLLLDAGAGPGPAMHGPDPRVAVDLMHHAAIHGGRHARADLVAWMWSRDGGSGAPCPDIAPSDAAWATGIAARHADRTWTMPLLAALGARATP